MSQLIESIARQEGRDQHADTWPEATQVKQKFGTLRLYLKNYSESMDVIREYAEMTSARTCELCGKPGASVACPGVKTLCPEHAQALSPEALAGRKNPV